VAEAGRFPRRPPGDRIAGHAGRYKTGAKKPPREAVRERLRRRAAGPSEEGRAEGPRPSHRRWDECMVLQSETSTERRRRDRCDGLVGGVHATLVQGWSYRAVRRETVCYRRCEAGCRLGHHLSGMDRGGRHRIAWLSLSLDYVCAVVCLVAWITWLAPVHIGAVTAKPA